MNGGNGEPDPAATALTLAAARLPAELQPGDRRPARGDLWRSTITEF